MEDEIKVGEDVRTKKGYIGKLIEIDKNYGGYYLDCMRCVSPENIVKHSPNIIDLIEVGDYVNGFYVVDRDKNGICVLLDTAPTCYSNIYEERHVKSIVTHEQFKAMEYKVKE